MHVVMGIHKDNYQENKLKCEYVTLCLVGKAPLSTQWFFLNLNIPILPGAFLTFESKSSVGPSYAANGLYEWC